jgi:predicted ATPase
VTIQNPSYNPATGNGDEANGPAAQIRFLERVGQDVHYAAEVKRNQVANGYANDTVASALPNDVWTQAQSCIARLQHDMPVDATREVAGILRRELTIDTVEHIDDLLRPALVSLRDAWESNPASATQQHVSESDSNGSNAQPGNTRLMAVTLRNFLSFGPQTQTLTLERLNVVIGPNGSGKSNLLDAIALLRSASSGLRPVILKGGGVSEWVWKGEPDGVASVDVVVSNPSGRQPLRHVVAFRVENQSFRIDDERIENEHAYAGENGPYFYYRFQNGRPVILPFGGQRRQLSRDTINPQLSILAQRRDPDTYPELTYLAEVYDQIRLYREWEFGRNTVFRQPQKADLRTDRLEEDFSNLGLFLNRLGRHPKAKRDVLSGLRNLYDGLTDFGVSIEGGTVQVFFTEGDFTIPATRLSDGSIRYLCLLAILCDPDPPPVIGIEEPELGLHPDLLPRLADLLVEASNRCQLIVTTHSDILVDALTERPDAVVVCEKLDGQTIMCRLIPDELAPWLDKYRLGQLWTSGQIGGTRW